MDENVYRRVESNPKFRELVEERGKFAVTLTVIMLLIYVGFILAVAFAPGWLGTPIAGGATTLGIPVGVVVILSAFVLTGVYVARANSRFDQLNAEILREVA